MGRLFKNFRKKVARGFDNVEAAAKTAGTIVESGVDSVVSGVATGGAVLSDAVLTGARVIGDDVVDYGEVGLAAVGSAGSRILGETGNLGAQIAGGILDSADFASDVAGLAVLGVGKVTNSKQLEDVGAAISILGNLGITADKFRSDGKSMQQWGKDLQQYGKQLADRKAEDLEDTFTENAREELEGFKERTKTDALSLKEKVDNERKVMADTAEAFKRYRESESKDLTEAERQELIDKMSDEIRKSKAENPGATRDDYISAALTVVGAGIGGKIGGTKGAGIASTISRGVKPAKVAQNLSNDKRRRTYRR